MSHKTVNTLKYNRDTEFLNEKEEEMSFKKLHITGTFRKSVLRTLYIEMNSLQTLEPFSLSLGVSVTTLKILFQRQLIFQSYLPMLFKC